MSNPAASTHTLNDVQDNFSPNSIYAMHKLRVITKRDLNYDFDAHFHPYAGQLHSRLMAASVRGLQEADTERVSVGGQFKLYEELTQNYKPVAQFVESPFPVKDLDFESDGAYSVYNWELFYHVPITVGIHLSRNGRFAEAQRWFHYVFDPTTDDKEPAPQRFWRVKKFQTSDVELIEDILINLATGADEKLRERTVDCIRRWREAPFRPHLVARYRHTAYMFKAVMAYLDNLIDWGDSLFRQDTGESVNEALQIYVLAANLLGARPQAVPRKGSVRPRTYASLKADLDEMGNAMVHLEAEIPFDLMPYPGEAGPGDQIATLRSIGSSLYFCIPRNDKLLAYWDTVADRLFKIRNSLNIQGIFRQLALFDPPIDPALLARATAAGLDISSVVNGLYQPLPLVRFGLLVQKAQEICQEVKSLGANLLSAIEKEDGEQLGLLRARHEKTLLELAKSVRFAQWQEATKNRNALEQSLRNAVEKYAYYENLLGNTDLKASDELDDIDIDALMVKLKYDQDEPGLGRHSLEYHHATDIDPDAEGLHLNKFEMEELSTLETAHGWEVAAHGTEIAASGASFIPDFEIAAKPMGAGAATTFGGTQVSRGLSMTASAFRLVSSQLSYEAGMAGRVGGYARRELEWGFQSNSLAGEIEATYKQLRAAQIREAVAQKEYQNHLTQIANAEEVELFLKGEKAGVERYRKTSTLAFYTWMKREVRGLYGQCFQFAFDVARKAERALQHELGDASLTFLQFGYTGGKEALLAGEKLHLDLKRMEFAYHELNQREYELTKHVSLRMLDPLALLALRATGRCTVSLPEALFDMDGPGHYFRRIKNVAVTIPCVVGPYASVNCTLTLTKSSIRKSPQLAAGEYARASNGDDAERFSDYFGSTQSIVTSTGQNDSGLFETNLRDERYLPFEGAGAISTWELSLPVEAAQFDPDTVSDVVLHLRYTAREGGNLLRDGAVANLKLLVQQATAAGSVRLLSVRHDFPTEWAMFTATPGAAELSLELKPEHYPFLAMRLLGASLTLLGVQMLAAGTGNAITISGQDTQLTFDDTLGARNGTVELTDDDAAIGVFKRTLNENTMKDLWLALTFGKPAE
jgi:Tc toxin complex TcA C-terminal TcB-binding domain